MFRFEKGAVAQGQSVVGSDRTMSMSSGNKPMSADEFSFSLMFSKMFSVNIMLVLYRDCRVGLRGGKQRPCGPWKSKHTQQQARLRAVFSNWRRVARRRI